VDNDGHHRSRDARPSAGNHAVNYLSRVMARAIFYTRILQEAAGRRPSPLGVTRKVSILTRLAFA